MTRIIEPELSYKVTGLCLQVHKDLGRFCSERQYSDKLEEKLIEAHMQYVREFELSNLPDVDRKGNRVDFYIDDKIILDAKAKKFITKEDYFQMNRYLEAANIELGMIVNFRYSFLKPKRVVNSKYQVRV
jgi:GxxExxY protein